MTAPRDLDALDPELLLHCNSVNLDSIIVGHGWTAGDLAREAVRLAADLAAAQRAAETLASIIDRQAKDICKITGVPMPEDGDADFALAWDRAWEMAAGLAAERAKLAALAGDQTESGA